MDTDAINTNLVEIFIVGITLHANVRGKRALVQFGSTSIIPTDALVLCPNFTYNTIKK